MIVLLLQILCNQSHDASHCGCGHRSSLHFHHAIVIITIQPTVPSAQRFGRELISWSHNIGLDGASAGTSARREIRDVVLSVLNSLGMRRSDGNHVLGEGRRRYRSKSAWLSFIQWISTLPPLHCQLRIERAYRYSPKRTHPPERRTNRSYIPPPIPRNSSWFVLCFDIYSSPRFTQILQGIHEIAPIEISRKIQILIAVFQIDKQQLRFLCDSLSLTLHYHASTLYRASESWPLYAFPAIVPHTCVPWPSVEVSSSPKRGIYREIFRWSEDPLVAFFTEWSGS